MARTTFNIKAPSELALMIAGISTNSPFLSGQIVFNTGKETGIRMNFIRCAEEPNRRVSHRMFEFDRDTDCFDVLCRCHSVPLWAEPVGESFKTKVTQLYTCTVYNIYINEHLTTS